MYKKNECIKQRNVATVINTYFESCCMKEQTEHVTIPLSGKLDDRERVWKNPRPIEELPKEIQQLVMNRRSANTRKKTTIDVLEEKHVLSTILYINRTSPVMKSDVYNDISRSSSMSDKLCDIENLGLIDVYQTIRNNSNILMITDKGRKVAGLIEDLVRILETDPEGPTLYDDIREERYNPPSRRFRTL